MICVIHCVMNMIVRWCHKLYIALELLLLHVHGGHRRQRLAHQLVFERLDAQLLRLLEIDGFWLHCCIAVKPNDVV